jgi:hypothetical protein
MCFITSCDNIISQNLDYIMFYIICLHFNEFDQTVHKSNDFIIIQQLLLVRCVSTEPAGSINAIVKAKAVPLHVMEALMGRGDVAPIHYLPWHWKG